MKKLIYYPFVLLLCVFVFSSCEEKIDLELDESFTRIVVEGEITTDQKAHLVKLSTSSSYFYNEQAPTVSDAEVSIADDQGNVFLLTEIPNGSGMYYTDSLVAGVVGNTYTLLIEGVDIDGDGKEEVYEASEQLMPQLPLDSLTFEYTETMIRGGQEIKGYAVNIWGQENPTPGDYYQWRYYKNGKLETDTISEYAFVDDGLVNGNYIIGFTVFVAQAQPGDTILVESRSMTKEYYEFVVSFLVETVWSGGGFGGPPANIKTNVSNGGMGWFNASYVSRVEGIIPDKKS